MRLKVIGGIGDALICASVSNIEHVTMQVKPHQLPLLNSLRNVTAIHFSGSRSDFQSMDGVFCGMRGLRQEDYYTLVEKRLGVKVSPPKFDFPANPNPKRVFIHTTPSDRNREWDNEKWKTVALSLRDGGYEVFFLGTHLDFGFSTEGVQKLSEISNDLLWQARKLATGTFLGVDSGFCHIAGILGIPGKVIFTNTHPKHVIARYSLEAIHPAEFSPDCVVGLHSTKSRFYANMVSVEQVLEGYGVSVSEANLLAQKPIIGMIPYDEKLAEHLKEFKVEEGEREITLYPQLEGKIRIKTSKRDEIFLAHPIHLRRAINECV